MASLKQHLSTQRTLGALCAQVVEQQIERGEAVPSQLRQRRRHLLKALRKSIPHNTLRTPENLLHSAVMVLALWGFSQIVMPNSVHAATFVPGVVVHDSAETTATFAHRLLEGFDAGEATKPRFADIDSDGDLDLFVGEFGGTVKYYKNIGTASAPSFVPANGTSIINPLAAVAVGSYAAPSFADIDADGDLDLFVGDDAGTLKFYRNLSIEDSGTASAPRFVAFAAGNPLSGLAVSGYATPTFVDINGDGDLDLFVGESTGTVKYYQNIGTASAPNFVPADEVSVFNPLLAVAVSGSSTPSFADIDNDGDLDAFVGDGYGAVKFYQNNGTTSLPSFVAADGTTVINPLASAFVGYSAAPTFADIDSDGDLDAFVGSSYSAMRTYLNTAMEDFGTATAPNFESYAAGNPMAGFAVSGYAAPIFADLDHDGDMDAFVGSAAGTVMFYQNNGTALAPNFVVSDGSSVINPLAGIDVGSFAAPAFADIDNDGDLDLFIGEAGGTVKFYRNNDTGSGPVFSADAPGNPLAIVAVGGYATPTFADIDSDGDLDAFVGSGGGTVAFYHNYSMEDVGNASKPDFSAANNVTIINPLASFNMGNYAAPTFADIDNDGDLDAFVGVGTGTVKFYQNSGTPSIPILIPADGVNVISPLAGFGVGVEAKPAFTDIDNDGDLDLFIGEGTGTVRYFENLETSLNGGRGDGYGGGGGAPGIPLLATLVALLAGGWRKKIAVATR